MKETILDESAAMKWNYDAGADALYISMGDPKLAVGVDIGDGVVARYDESNGTIVGLTLIGLREKVTMKNSSDV